MKHTAREKGFTLIELLVVIAVIAMLLSILVPALATVKQRARIGVCKSNFHQWGIGVKMYANNNKGWYPAHDVNTGCGENTWDVGYKFVLEMHDSYNIPYEMFFCPAQENNKYPGDDTSAFRTLMWYSLASQTDTTSTALSATNCRLATLRFSLWIPRHSTTDRWFPIKLGADSARQPTEGAPRKDSDRGSVKPIITDWCYGDTVSDPPDVEKDITGGGHKLRGKFHSVNSVFGDGHVESRNAREVQPQFQSRQRYDWW